MDVSRGSRVVDCRAAFPFVAGVADDCGTGNTGFIGITAGRQGNYRRVLAGYGEYCNCRIAAKDVTARGSGGCGDHFCIISDAPPPPDHPA